VSKRPRNSPRSAPPRHAPRDEYLYGINPVAAALPAARRRLHALYRRSGPAEGRLAEVVRLAERAGLPVEERAPRDLEALCGSSAHQGVVLHCGPLPVTDAGAALTPAPPPDGLLVALDQVEDPHNLGAVARACAVFGAQGIVLTRHESAPPSPSASKASAGYLETLPLYEAANLARWLAQARDAGYWNAATAADGDTPLPTFRRDRPLVVVLGSEGRGVRRLVRERCDFLVTIPMVGGESLNVSQAAAVVLYQLSLRD